MLNVIVRESRIRCRNSDGTVSRSSKWHEIEIEGCSQGLRQLADWLVSDAASNKIELNLPKDILPAPYEKFMSNMQVIRNNAKLRVIYRGTTLLITGSLEYLTILAETIKGLAEAVQESARQPHLHIEYWPDHFYLDPGSEPLVVTLLADKV
jgi:hypothetical protein